MYKKVLENIQGVEIFAEISLIVFFVFFLLIIGWTLTLSKNYVSKMKHIPLDNNHESGNENNLNAGGVK